MAVGAIFKSYSRGVTTSREAWAYNASPTALTENMTKMIAFYNAETARWEHRTDRTVNVNDFVNPDNTKIKWTDRLKSELKNNALIDFSPEKVRIFSLSSFYQIISLL